MSLNVPPQVAWPAFVIALFVTGGVGTLAMVWIAASDGGVQVIDNYYEKAVNWDSTAAQQEASNALNWTMRARFEQSAGSSGRNLVIEITDQLGLPVSDLSGIVRLYRPEVANALAEEPLRENPEGSGTYRLEIPFGRRGLWDIEIEAERNSQRYREKIRTEIR